MVFARLHVSRTLLDAVIAHARAEAPNECCGLLAGVIENGEAWAVRHFPIRNDLASPTEYLTNARDLLDAMKAMRVAGLEVLAIYHSHPTSEPIPSKMDVARNTWGETVMHLIVRPVPAIPFSRDAESSERSARAWWIGESDYREAELVID